jgi:hypothetical protein
VPTLSCLCGRTRIELSQLSDFIHACNCALCGKTGAHWGYLDPSEVVVHGVTTGYVRDDKDAPAAEVHFCPTCGTTSHFVLTPSAVRAFGNTMMGVNMRLADERDLAGIELRFPDGRAWDGSGAFAYVRPPVIIGEDDPAG